MNSDRLEVNNRYYQYKALRDILLNLLGRNDVKAADLGPTYHSRPHDTSSELDHRYCVSTLMNQ